MIDIHSHLLPGVDDGSPSVDVSVGVLRRFADEGVETVVCTPHLTASEAHLVPHERYEAVFADLQVAAPAVPRLLRGWEIMLDVPGADLRDRRLTLAGSSAVLVEFPRNGVPAAAAHELFRLRSSGVIPVVAHPERYWGVTPATVAEWRRVGAVIQTDTASLIGGGWMQAFGRTLLAEGLIDCLASDNHGDGRGLGVLRQWLEELGATEQARLLTSVNASRLLASQPPLPVAPVVVRTSAVRRLRNLLFGRRRSLN